MRGLKGLLIAAALTAAPATVVAGPSRELSSPPPTVEKFEWSKGRLGVMVMSLTPELRKHLGAAQDRGVLVARVEPGSPAAAAGIAVGDVIVDVQGRAIDDASDVRSVLAEIDAGKKVPVEVVRNKQPLSLQVAMTGTRPSEAAVFNPSWSQWLREMMKPFDVAPPRA